MTAGSFLRSLKKPEEALTIVIAPRIIPDTCAVKRVVAAGLGAMPKESTARFPTLSRRLEQAEASGRCAVESSGARSFFTKLHPGHAVESCFGWC